MTPKEEFEFIRAFDVDDMLVSILKLKPLRLNEVQMILHAVANYKKPSFPNDGPEISF